MSSNIRSINSTTTTSTSSSSSTSSTSSSSLPIAFHHITQAHLNQFINDGYCVVENVFSDAEVDELRRNLHDWVRERHDLDYANMDANSYNKLKVKPLDCYYAPWKMNAMLSDRVFGIASEIMRETFHKRIDGFDHEFPDFNPNHGYVYFDRVAFRLPDRLHPGKGLVMHCDMNPYVPLSRGNTKWRPLQMSLALTDHFDDQSGGLGVAPGWHRRIIDYCAANPLPTPPTTEFNIFARDRHPKVHQNATFVRQPRGAVVVWDNRLPHFTCERHALNDTREVMFTTFLPVVPANVSYMKRQLKCYVRNQIPPDFALTPKDADADPRFIPNQLQRRLIGLEEWTDDDE